MSHLVLYDGVCGLCDHFVQFLIRIDRHDRLRFAAVQGPLGKAILEKAGRSSSSLSTVIVVADQGAPAERLLERSDAALFAVATAGGLYPKSPPNSWASPPARRPPDPRANGPAHPPLPRVPSSPETPLMPTSRRPNETDQEYEARVTMEQQRREAMRRHAALPASDREQLKRLHWMRCAKCGEQLTEVQFRDVKVDKCFACGGVYLDDGELEQLTGKPGWFESMLRFFRN